MVLTYLDDILIMLETEEEHDRYVLALLDCLYSKGHQISYKKAQMSQSEFNYFGQKNLPGQARNRT